MYTVFDSETSGLVNWGKSHIDESQPKLVQLAAILFTDEGKELSSISVIIQPDGFQIPVQASNIHGISTSLAEQVGVSLKTAIELFAEFVDISDTVVAHNAKFDIIVLRKAVHHLGYTGDIFSGKKIHCTKDASTPILKIPKTTGNGYKWPKLSEAYKYFFGIELEGAHDALVDTRACAEVYAALKNKGAFQ
jgi:DNA polymerase III subunit epsilon